MSKEKQTTREAAWKKYVQKTKYDTTLSCRIAHESGFRAGEEGKAELLEALVAILARDECNTCRHENTHRGGAIWEICDDCGAEWADDKGGKPKWKDPPEWKKARAAIAKHTAK